MTSAPLLRIMLEPLVRGALLEDLGRAGDLTTDAIVPADARTKTALVARQPGFLGAESARDDVAITVSYWRDEESAAAWKQVAEHMMAQQRGRDAWYRDYQVRVATVTRSYGPDGPR